MRKKFIFVVLILLTTACSTHYELARKHFDKAQHYYRHKRHSRSIIEYSRSLDKLKFIEHNHYGQLLRAVVFDQLYLIDGTAIWHNSEQSVQVKCRTLGNLINESEPAVDFLDRSFQQVKIVDGELKNLDMAKLESWLLVEKDVIVADFLVRRASQKFETVPVELKKRVPETFVDKLRRYTLYKIAKNFYLSAWLRSDRLDPKKKNADVAELKKMCRQKLKDVYWSLDTVASSVSYAGRTEDFTWKFKNDSRHFKEVRKKIEKYSLLSEEPGAKNLPNEELRLKSLDEVIEKNFMVLDPNFQLKEGRSKISSAIEEVLREKKDKAQDYLLLALTHFMLARELQGPRGGPDKQMLNDSLTDTYLQLHRLTSQ